MSQNFSVSILKSNSLSNKQTMNKQKYKKKSKYPNIQKIFLNTIFSQSNKHILKNIDTNYVNLIKKIFDE